MNLQPWKHTSIAPVTSHCQNLRGSHGRVWVLCSWAVNGTMPHLWFLDLGNNNFSGQVPVGWGMKGITWILTSKGACHNHSWWCFPAQSMRALLCSSRTCGLGSASWASASFADAGSA